MHELAIAESVVDVGARAHRRPAGQRRAAAVGRLSGVVPDAMRFCFELATAGTTARGRHARDRASERGRAHCRSCGADFDLDDPFLLCPCGSADVELLSGRELSVTSVEVA